jgi:hypothetical protein
VARLPGKDRFLLVRVVSAAFGVCSIAWVIAVIPVYRAEAGLADAARAILAEEGYRPAQLTALERRLDATPPGQLRSKARDDAAVVRLRLLEIKLATVKRRIVASDVAEFESIVVDALAGSPTNSYLWLIEHWLRTFHDDGGQPALAALRASYASGPNEGWIAVRRNQLALRVFASLPDDLSDAVLKEFGRVVRSGFYLDASNILAGSQGPVRDRLLIQLTGVPEADRIRLARVLASKNLDGVMVPGVDAKRSRPF